MVLTFEEKLAGLRAQMTPEIRASLQEEAVKAGERRNWRTPEEAKEELFSAFKNFSVAVCVAPFWFPGRVDELPGHSL